MSPLEPSLEVRDLQVVRDGFCLQVPYLHLPRGEILSLIGPNGSGKTTLLMTLAGLVKPVSGEVVFRGQRVTGSSDLLAYRRRVTMVFQESLLLNTTVFGNVATGLKLRGIPGTEAAARVMENLNRFGIHHLMDRSARTLSGGEAQRTSLARALAIRPELLLLDEPFGALDPPTREALMEDLQVVLRDTRTTTVLATHDRLEALQLSDRIGVMAAGRIIQIGSPREVMGSPADDLVAAFVSVDRVRRLLQTRLNGEP